MELERIVDEGQPEAREKLEVELHAIHERGRAIDEELEEIERRDRGREPRPSRPRDSDADEHARILNERLQEIRAEIAGAERELRRTEDRDGDHAHELKAHIDELHMHMGNTEEELLGVRRQRAGVERERRAETRVRRRDVDAPENERRLESEVVELRGRVDGMHEEMVQMRRLLERLLERRDTEGEVQEMEIEY
jgi:chromosome segregation ATPase